MRPIRATVLAAAAVAALGISLAAGQLPQLPAGVRDLTERIPDLDRFLAPGPVLTSSVADAAGRVGSLPDGVTDGRFASLFSLPRGSRGEFLLREGNFSAIVESFCLKAGASAATGGDGFLAAPLKGPWAPIIEGILRNAGRIPGVPQEDVQLLLWDLLARTKVSDLSPALQAVAAQLLSPRDLFTVNGGALGLVPQQALDLAEERLPAGLREAFAAESRIRQMVADGVSNYESFESVAVPDAADVRGQIAEIGDDQWIRTAQGFFVRFAPIGYQRVRVEIVVPRASARGPRLVAIAFQPGAQPVAAPAAIDLPSILAMPADTGGQRLGLTTIPAPDAQPGDGDVWVDQTPPTPVTPTTPPTPVTPTTPPTPVTPTTPPTPVAPTTPPTPVTPTTPPTPVTPTTPPTPVTPTTPPTPVTPPPASSASPVAVLTVNPGVAMPNQTVALDGSASYAAGGRVIVRYRWQIGEGGAPADTETSRTTASSPRVGKVPITLVVVDDAGNASAPANADVIVADNRAPTAVLDLPAAAAAGQSIAASGARSTAASGLRLVTYQWRVGESASTTTESSTLSIPAPPVGKLTVSLVVVDEAGNASAPATASLIVQQRAIPTAVLTVNPAVVTPNQAFVADGSASFAAAGSVIVKYRWQVGEGAPVTETAGPRLTTSVPRIGKVAILLWVVDDAGNQSAAAAGSVIVAERD